MTPLPLDTSVPALVVRLDENPFHHGELGAVRSLGRAGVPVHVLAPGGSGAAASSRYTVGRHAWPTGVTPVQGLRALAERLGPVVPLAVDDASAMLLAESADALRGPLLLPTVPPGLPRQLADKAGLAAACAAAGVPTVSSTVVDDRAQLEALVEGSTGAWAVKTARPWEQQAGVPRVRRATGPEALALYDAAPRSLVLQPWVPATPGGDVSCVGVLADDGGAGFCATSVKLRSWPVGAGLTTLGRAHDLPDVVEASVSALRAFGYRGLFDLDWRFDPATGQHRLLDVNPRLGAQSRVVERVDGVDAARALHLTRTGRTVPAGVPVRARTLLVEQYDALALPGSVRAAGAGAWLRGLRGPRELAWFASDDLGPVRHLLRTGGGRALAKARSRAAA